MSTQMVHELMQLRRLLEDILKELREIKRELANIESHTSNLPTSYWKEIWFGSHNFRKTSAHGTSIKPRKYNWLQHTPTHCQCRYRGNSIWNCCPLSTSINCNTYYTRLWRCSSCVARAYGRDWWSKRYWLIRQNYCCAVLVCCIFRICLWLSILPVRRSIYLCVFWAEQLYQLVCAHQQNGRQQPHL